MTALSVRGKVYSAITFSELNAPVAFARSGTFDPRSISSKGPPLYKLVKKLADQFREFYCVDIAHMGGIFDCGNLDIITVDR